MYEQHHGTFRFVALDVCEIKLRGNGTFDWNGIKYKIGLIGGCMVMLRIPWNFW